MFAVTAARFSSDDPLSALELGEHAEPVPPDGWTTVDVQAASLNHHDAWTLRGVGISAARLPMILGCDAAGADAEATQPAGPPPLTYPPPHTPPQPPDP